ncbi:heavy-metal-associated domain-containing protein [Pseudomonas sp. TCU-HL1]|uniref:heavy-metal-associated domain-containing protein n=1 Tax=Pseudomonas sp. TCU-HL1 TaxID=1856685 RepID=UPI00083D717D|nr:heavy-metal-associated domain-containing protein [Pseudomonas sp. TCU-HL1]AOE85112.1 heavy metal transporter [Pseudomonas sp. TCU-HL1]
MFVLEVSGMGCGSCVSKITKAIQAADSQAKVIVDRIAGKVSVESLIGAERVSELVKALGYPTRISA